MSNHQHSSLMAAEAQQVPDIITAQSKRLPALCQKIAQQIQAFDPALVFMVGRGSSDHAGVFAKYLIETELNLPVAAAAPSVTGVFDQTLKLNSTIAIVISQSGQSPDLLKQAQSCLSGGAIVIAIVNDEASPLAKIADAVIPIMAGPELAVAATKSFISTLTAIMHLVAAWKRDEKLTKSIQALPAALEEVIVGPAQLTSQFVKPATRYVVLGRGFGYAIAREVALKLKEVLGIHAEAFSSAEFVHGPITLAERELSVLGVMVVDESQDIHQQQLEDVAKRGAELTILTSPNSSIYARLSPILILLRFYLDIEQLAQKLGFNPDAPPGLKKVTETI